jgi:DHA2 family multidrug resistance protein
MTSATQPVSASGRALHAMRADSQRLSIHSWRPYVGIVGVLLGAIMSTLGTRVTNLGLADLRGGLHVGFDEGAWMTTSFGVGQMLIGVCCPYVGGILGVRRVLLLGIVVFFTSSLLAPVSPNLPAFLAMQFLSGVGSGTFIPLSMGFIARSLPTRLIIYGVAIYAMNSELSQNVAASLEGWYTENLSWRWINWQYCPVLPLMFACVWYGIPREDIKTEILHHLDWPGMAYAGLGFGLLYAGLDQGNRLDWTNNGLVSGLLVSGALVTMVLLVRELWVARSPFLNLRLLLRHHLVLLMVLMAGYRFIILSTSYIIPSYLQTVQNFRELQVGSVLLWIALPQFAIVLPLGYLLTRVNARWVLAAGACFVGIACLMGAQLTSVWATDDFLQSQVLQALGQSFALTSLIALIVQSMNPADALTIGALLQTSRLFGGEIGTAFMQTFVRQREQIHSNLIGLHVDTLSTLTADRITAYRNAVGAHTSDLATATAQATNLLASAITKQASVLAYIDGFHAAAVGALVCLFCVMILPPTRTDKITAR